MTDPNALPMTHPPTGVPQQAAAAPAPLTASEDEVKDGGSGRDPMNIRWIKG